MLAIRDVEQWGDVIWTNMEWNFYGCSNLEISATDAPNLSNVTNMTGMFRSATAFNQPIDHWNTSNVTNMSMLFHLATSFNQPLGNWNTSNVTDMGWMFHSASAFNQPIANWNTSNVTSMIGMFMQASSFNQPLGNWNTSNVTKMNRMFTSATSFNQSLASWNTSNVTDMNGMFAFASSFNQPVNNWNTSSVVNMSEVFRSATSFNQPLNNWNLSNISNMQSMLNNNAMSCENYSSTLIGWSSNTNTPNSITLGASGRQYGTNALVSRNNLITNKGWTISGDVESGTNCSALATIEETSENILKVYPNPTNSILYVEISQPTTIFITDINGIEVLYKEVCKELKKPKPQLTEKQRDANLTSLILFIDKVF
jgi:surface protein